MTSGVGIFAAADLDALLEDFGARVVIDGVIGKAIVDERDEEGLPRPGGGALQIGRVILATVRTSAYPGVQHGSLVQLGPPGAEVEHRVWRKQLLGDGAYTELALRTGS